ncbi:hypothetical protein C1646_765429 [Rhizophagus diaphanus]|nr:hypothetical protein C1646_765429 [Rhizophagus diaphanus] [Rhizophagus sp. MUCL 43196]
MQNSTAILLLTAQLEDVYYDLFNNTSSLEVLQQYIKDLELELRKYVIKTQETFSNDFICFHMDYV